jgi:hypothetical protein
MPKSKNKRKNGRKGGSQWNSMIEKKRKGRSGSKSAPTSLSDLI